MTIITQTIYSRALAMQRKIGKPYDPLPYSTINELLSLSRAVPWLPDNGNAARETHPEYDSAQDTNSMVMKYLMIGNNGHRTIYGENLHSGMPAPIDWAANNGGFYNAIPFKVVPIEDALSPNERAKYRMRVVLQIDGSLYESYWAMVVDFPNNAPEYRIYRKENNVIVDSALWTPTIDNLLPQHPTGDLTQDKTHVSVTQPYNAILTPTMINDIVEACVLLYGRPEAAMISEVAMCHGVDKSVTSRYGVEGGSPSTIQNGLFFEAVALQVDTHLSMVQPISFNHTGFAVDLQVGGGVPLYPTSSTGN